MSLQHAALNTGAVGQAIPLSTGGSGIPPPPRATSGVQGVMEAFEQGGVQRGEMRGDNCLTIDLSAVLRSQQDKEKESISMAIFNESKTRCSLVKDTVSTGVRVEGGCIDVLNIIEKSAYSQIADMEGVSVKTEKESNSDGNTSNGNKKKKAQKGNDDSQIVYPLSHLSSSKMQIKSNDDDDNDDEQPECYTTLLLSPILRQCLDTAQDDDEYVTGKIKNRKVKPTSLTFILPIASSGDSNKKLTLINASRGALPLCKLKNIWNSGIACVSGVVNRLADSPQGLQQCINASAGEKDNHLILYLYYDDTTKRVTEAAIVLCSGHSRAVEQGCRSQYGRLSTLATADFEEGVDVAVDEQRGAILTFLERNKCSGNEIDAVVFSGPSDTTSIASIVTTRISTMFKGKTILVASPSDPATGGCLLTAAELESSKQYLKSEARGSSKTSTVSRGKAPGWKMHYLYAVGDGFLERDVSIEVESKESGKESREGGEGGGGKGETKNEREQVYTRGTVHKKEYGPPLPPAPDGKGTIFDYYYPTFSQATIYKEYAYGGLFRDEKAVVRDDGKTWPAITFLERVQAGVGTGEGGGAWTPVTTLHPLSDAGGAVTTSNVRIGIDSHTSMVTYKVDRGPGVKTAKEGQLWYMYIIAFVVAVVATIVATMYYKEHSKTTSVARDIKWCEEVYAVVNAEKLEDSAFCRRTVLKYRDGDRLWALHRILGREYERELAAAEGFVYSLPPSLA